VCYNIPTEFGRSENGWRCSLYRCLLVGGRGAGAEARRRLRVEPAAAQILAVVADTRMRCRALKEKGFCGRGNRAELAGAKATKENRASSRGRTCTAATRSACGQGLHAGGGSSSRRTRTLRKGQPARQCAGAARRLRENTCARAGAPYLNRNGSPGREPTVYGTTYVREFGKLDL